MPIKAVLGCQNNFGVGYITGGLSAADYLTLVQGLRFNTEVLFNTAANISQKRSQLGGYNSLVRGYVVGGYYGPGAVHGFTTIDGFVFATEAYVAVTETLDANKVAFASANSDAKGYSFAGSNWVSNFTFVKVKTIDAFAFSNETIAILAATFSTETSSLAGCNSQTKGFGGGGMVAGSAVTKTVRGVTFVDDAYFLASQELGTARHSLTAFSSQIRGYWAGGSIDTNEQNEIDGIRFDTEAAISVGVNLGTARQSLTSVKSLTNGYAIAGSSYTGTLYKSIERFKFADESIATIAAEINAAASAQCGFQKGAK